jgi:hypothetical protein
MQMARASGVGNLLQFVSARAMGLSMLQADKSAQARAATPIFT